MSLLEIEQAAAHRDSEACETDLTAVNLQIAALEGQLQQATDPSVIAILTQQKAALTSTAGAMTQALAALKAHEDNVARWIATMAQPAADTRALADLASELLALLDTYEGQLRVSKDKHRVAEEATWATSLRLEDLLRNLGDLDAEDPAVDAKKAARDEARSEVQLYLDQLTT